MKLETEIEKVEIANTGADIQNIRKHPRDRIVIVWVRQPRPLGAGVSLQSNTPNPATTVNIRRMTGPRAFSPVEIGPYLDFGEPQTGVREIRRWESYKQGLGRNLRYRGTQPNIVGTNTAIIP
jgi:hypothetical protein